MWSSTRSAIVVTRVSKLKQISDPSRCRFDTFLSVRVNVVARSLSRIERFAVSLSVLDYTVRRAFVNIFHRVAWACKHDSTLRIQESVNRYLVPNPFVERSCCLLFEIRIAARKCTPPFSPCYRWPLKNEKIICINNWVARDSLHVRSYFRTTSGRNEKRMVRTRHGNLSSRG